MYEDYEVHKTFTAPVVGAEMIAVLKNGNKGRIVSAEFSENCTPLVFGVQFSENGTLEVSAYEVDHYLTPPKPGKTPDRQGLWEDKDGRVWMFVDAYHMRVVGWLRPDGMEWIMEGEYATPASLKEVAPFTRLEARRPE